LDQVQQFYFNGARGRKKKKIFNFSITIIIILLLSLLWSSVEHSVYSVGGYAPTVQQQQQQPEGQTLPPGGIPYDAHCLLKKKNLKKKKGGPRDTLPKHTEAQQSSYPPLTPRKTKKTFVFFWFFFLVWHQQLSYMVAVERASMAVVCWSPGLKENSPSLHRLSTLLIYMPSHTLGMAALKSLFFWYSLGMIPRLKFSLFSTELIATFNAKDKVPDYFPFFSSITGIYLIRAIYIYM